MRQLNASLFISSTAQNHVTCLTRLIYSLSYLIIFASVDLQEFKNLIYIYKSVATSCFTIQFMFYNQFRIFLKYTRLAGSVES